MPVKSERVEARAAYRSRKERREQQAELDQRPTHCAARCVVLRARPRTDAGGKHCLRTARKLRPSRPSCRDQTGGHVHPELHLCLGLRRCHTRQFPPYG